MSGKSNVTNVQVQGKRKGSQSAAAPKRRNPPNITVRLGKAEEGIPAGDFSLIASGTVHTAALDRSYSDEAISLDPNLPLFATPTAKAWPPTPERPREMLRPLSIAQQIGTSPLGAGLRNLCGVGKGPTIAPVDASVDDITKSFVGELPCHRHSSFTFLHPCS